MATIKPRMLHVPHKFLGDEEHVPKVKDAVDAMIRGEHPTRYELADVLQRCFDEVGEPQRQNWLETERWVVDQRYVTPDMPVQSFPYDPVSYARYECVAMWDDENGVEVAAPSFPMNRRLMMVFERDTLDGDTTRPPFQITATSNSGTPITHGRYLQGYLNTFSNRWQALTQYTLNYAFVPDAGSHIDGIWVSAPAAYGTVGRLNFTYQYLVHSAMPNGLSAIGMPQGVGGTYSYFGRWYAAGGWAFPLVVRGTGTFGIWLPPVGEMQEYGVWPTGVRATLWDTGGPE